MDLTRASGWTPPDRWTELTVIESHTGGEPFRLVIDGLPDIPGRNVLEKRAYARTHLDWLRRATMLEPRGHADMYGGWIGPPTSSDADLSVLFVHNEGFSTMCGHGIIALTKIALETGILPINGNETTVTVETPAGRIVSTASTADDLVGVVRFQNVPSFVDRLDSVIPVDRLGDVTFDLAFGGAYYAYVDAVSLGMKWPPWDQSELVKIGRKIKRAIEAKSSIVHPLEPDLGFLYGVIFTGPPSNPANAYRNVCVFADGEVDRSPTGTGVSGRIAIDAARGVLHVGDSITIESILGSEFHGTYISDDVVGEYMAVVPEISGSAHITGRSTLWIDPKDSIGSGFLLR